MYSDFVLGAFLSGSDFVPGAFLYRERFCTGVKMQRVKTWERFCGSEFVGSDVSPHGFHRLVIPTSTTRMFGQCARTLKG